MSKLPIFELFLSVGNLKPKLKLFIKPANIFLLNWAPELGIRVTGGEDAGSHEWPWAAAIAYNTPAPGAQFNSFVEISTDFSTDFSTEFLVVWDTL